MKRSGLYLIKTTYVDWVHREHIIYWGKGLKFVDDTDFNENFVSNYAILRDSVPRLFDRIPNDIYFKGNELSLINKETIQFIWQDGKLQNI